MIPKRIPMKKVNLSSFAKLTDYITHSQGKNERVGKITVTNCHASDPWWAAQEVEGVQRQNNRTKMDKTYHLLLSFRAGENPSQETLQQIEQRMVAVIGYGEHQRISAVHHDTDHLHIHIAINKIHPTKFIAVEPYYDKRKLSELAGKLEVEYGLEQENHIPHLSKGAAKAQDMEKSAGIESLIGWVKRNLLSELLLAKSWEYVHNALAKHGLQLTPRGNGLIITNGTVTAKASSIHRRLSKKAWEEKLGAFQPATIAKAKSRGSDGYKIRPMASNVDTTALWQKYQLERVQSGGTSWRMEKAKERRDRSIKSAKIGARAKRALIKLMEPGLGKRMLRHQVSQGLLKEIKQINQAYMNERASYIKDTGNRLIWHDWLKAQAAAGNTEAIAVLRGRYERQNMKGNVIANSAPGNDNLEIIKTERKIDTVTKRGTVHLKVPGGIIRDDGKSFRMSDSLSDNALRVMLRLAVERFGTQLDVRGTEKFKSAIVNIVHCEKINVTFSDPAMMKQKQALLEQRIAAEKRQKTIAAAEKYVANQNDKHSKGMAHILPHRLFKPEEAGQYIFGGWRSQEEGRMALLKSAPTAKEILVLPLDPDSFQRIRFLDDGSKIAVSPSGDLQIIENARSQSQTLVRQIGHHTSR